MELPWEPEWHVLMLICFSQSLKQTFFHALLTSLTCGGVTDDILMIWTHSVDDLQTFTTYLSNIHPTIKFTSNYILSHPYHFLTSTCLSLTVRSRLTFTLNLPTNINTYYNLHVILNTPRELFHSA